ncbi:heavy-metal-associated domain-containing protein [Haloimpatiens sp. FM7330]|uniref:heavy-metal-associated domain-containing protein n=1 Tax=Haloimpatiens sp. FM7330 TaxID=3298610 RepID=UPI00364464A0
MKSIFKISSIKNNKDVMKIKNAITNYEGIVACQINKENGVVEVVYDNYFINEEAMSECIENLGYTII